ncbi:M1 family metallopeptidase [Roseivirga sp. BDSF3-8]|uniref:M1 family metallopeptidase n=1 Tax=Roseivirga sp. BDSF3-8 TaxID=3241598 RepID=UPI003531B35F
MFFNLRNIATLLAAATLIMAGCAESETGQQSETPENNDMMLTKDPHTFARPEEAVMKHLDLNLTVDFASKSLSGIAGIEISRTEDAKQLILDTKGLSINEVLEGKTGEESLKYSLGEKNDYMGQALVIELNDDTDYVRVDYSTSPEAEALQWLEPVQTAGDQPFLFTQSQAILARSWIPLQDSPGIRFTYSANVQVPENLLALMSAENPTEKSADGTYNFKMKQPIPAYLMALSVGDLVFEPLGEKTGVYAEPATIEKAAYEFAELDEMLEAAESLYGSYRWDRYDLLVLPPSFPFGGMENPRLTFVTPTILAGDRSLTSLVAHELAHSWSGNLVTNATWNDFWLNEGFTVYFENRIMEEVFGRDYSEMLATLAQKDLKGEVKKMIADGNGADTKLKLDLEGRNPDDGVTSIAYDKGYFFLRYLEETVGRKEFDAFLTEYFNSNAFSTMTTEGFLAYLSENLYEANGLEPDTAVFNAWIYREGLPASMPEVESTRFAQVDEALTAWQNGTPASELDTANWSSHEWLHFVRELPDDLDTTKLEELDEAFGFTSTGNSEVLTAWLVLTIKNDYTSAYNRLEEFLINTGRRKFLVPIYGAMLETQKGKEMAKEIYRKARPNYHFVSTNTLDKMIMEQG